MPARFPLTPLAALLLFPHAIACFAGREPADRPNVIIVFLDDSGYGDFAHNGNPVIETPHISRIAREGANFTQFYVTSPACSASRYSLLTGRYPGRSGLGSWVVGPGAANHLSPEEFSIARGLKSKGYATAIFGKWHLGTPSPANGHSPDAFPLAHGFDQWLGTDVSHDYEVARLIASDPDSSDPIPGYRTLARDLPSDDEASRSLTARYTEAAVRFIQSHHQTPFFLYLAHNQPHLALHVDGAFEGSSRRGLLGDVMAEIDSSVGQLLEALQQAGIAENTLLIFTSDNGPWIRFAHTASHPRYGEARLHVGYAHPFRDGKGSNWEGGHRVPAIFHWPGTIPPRHQLEPASTLDILPTVFALAGVEPPDARPIDGRDIRQFLLDPGRSASLPSPAPFDFAFSNAANQPVALRSGPWKLHLATTSQTGQDYGMKASREHPLLFQVEHDLSESFNRASEFPDVVDDLLQRLDSIRASIQEDASLTSP